MWVDAGQTTILDNFPLKRGVFSVFGCMGGVRGPKKGWFREHYLERSVSRFEFFFCRSSPNHLFRWLKLNYEFCSLFGMPKKGAFRAACISILCFPVFRVCLCFL